MKKRFLFLLLLLIIISTSFVSSASQKIVVSSILLPISINKVIIDNNIQVLVESKNLNKIYIMFDIKDSLGNTKRYFTGHILNPYEATYFSIPLEMSNPTYLYATPYHQSGSTITLYDSSKEVYTFTGSEYKTATTSALSTVTSGQSIATVTTTSDTNTNTDTKVLYVRGIQKIQDNNIEYLHNDYLGSTRRASNGNTGEQTLSSDYYYFGSPLMTQGYSLDLSSNNKEFTSKEQDDKSGLYYFGARYYNPSIGRFVSVDPLYKPSETPYNYAGNNPLKFIDPTGASSQGAFPGLSCGSVCDLGDVIYGKRDSSPADATYVSPYYKESKPGQSAQEQLGEFTYPDATYVSPSYKESKPGQPVLEQLGEFYDTITDPNDPSNAIPMFGPEAKYFEFIGFAFLGSIKRVTWLQNALVKENGVLYFFKKEVVINENAYKNYPGLAKISTETLAESDSGVKKSLIKLKESLYNGNINAGIGARPIEDSKNIYEMRSGDGARIIFQIRGDIAPVIKGENPKVAFDILAKTVSHTGLNNHQHAINILRDLGMVGRR